MTENEKKKSGDVELGRSELTVTDLQFQQCQGTSSQSLSWLLLAQKTQISDLPLCSQVALWVMQVPDLPRKMNAWNAEDDMSGSAASLWSIMSLIAYLRALYQCII